MIKQELKSGYLQLAGDINKKVNPTIADEGMYKLEGFNLDEALSITKRAGYQKLNSVQLTEGGSAATFTGLFDYVKSDLTRQQIATALKGVYRYNSPVANAWNSLTLPAAVCTMTIASPCVVTIAAHGKTAGQAVVFTTTGALPTGITSGTTYYVISTGLATDTFRVSATAGGSVVNTSGSQSGVHTATQINTGTAANLYDASVFGDLFYIGNGIDANLKYNGTTVYNMGIQAPSSTATVALAGLGAGNLANGVYYYKITFYNSTLGHESNPSASSASVTVADKTTNGQVALSAIPVSSDTQVNARRIYRTTVGGGVWLLLATISNNTATTYTDNLADASLGIAIDGFGNGVPPLFSMIEIWQGHAFTAGPNSSNVWFSKSNKPNAVDSNDSRGLDANDGDNVTGLRRLSNFLVAFKTNSIWNAYGTDRNTFGFTRYVTDTGAVNNACIVNVPVKNVLAFIDANARFWFYNGSSVEPTALGLETDLNGLNQSQLTKAVGSVHKPKNQCRWIVPNAEATQNGLMIWYDYLEDKWGTQPIDNVKANYIAELKDSASKNQNYLAGYTGYVLTGDTGGSDDSSAVACEVIDRGHPNTGGPDPNAEQMKTFHRVLVMFKTVSGTTITVSYSKDDPDGTYTSIGTIDCSATSGQATLPCNITCNRLYLKITESGTGTTLTLRGWRAFYKLVGMVG